jgi:drug/metabolite transporter (DMT)-like permease
VRDRPLLTGSLVLVVAATGFGLLGPLAKIAYDAGFAPLAFVTWRAAFGLAVIVAVIALRARRGVAVVDPRRLPRGDRLGLVAVAASAIGVNVATFIAFDLTTVAIALLAFYTYPAMVAVVAVALGHERLDATRVGALGLALAGMVLVVGAGLATGAAVTVNPLGVVLGLVAAAWQTLFVTVSRGRFASVPAEQVMGGALAATAVFGAVAALATGSTLATGLASPSNLAIVAVAGIAAAGIPSVLLLTGIRLVGGTRSGILMLFEPLVGVTLAALWLGETLAPIQVAGGIAILGAALLLQLGSAEAEGLGPAAVPVPAAPVPTPPAAVAAAEAVARAEQG